jgi:hypothetical protein
VSLADQIDALNFLDQGCRTCAWYARQDEETQSAFDRYIARQNPEKPVYKPLYDLCCENGLNVSSKTFRDHINAHHGRGR